MSTETKDSESRPVAVPSVVDQRTWDTALAELRVREKAATRELDAIAAARRRLPMVELPEYTLEGADGPIRLADIFAGKPQLIVYHHMWFPGEEWHHPRRSRSTRSRPDTSRVCVTATGVVRRSR